MGLIADKCPRCNRVTRCLVTERGGVVGGLVLGIPFALPLSSVSCVCAECGHEFQGRLAAVDRAVPPEVAAGLDTDGLLALTNPDLWQVQTLSRLRAEPRLQDAFLLLDRLAPGRLNFGLRADMARWPALGEPDRADLLQRVEACARAEAFARSMAGRYPSGAAGCLAGVVLAVGVWVAAWFTLRYMDVGALGWALVAIAGLAAGGLPGSLLSQTRGRRWVRDVLIPEADRAGVLPEWVLAVLEGTAAPGGTEDELSRIRDLGPVLREELVAGGRDPNLGAARFGQLPRAHEVPGGLGQGPDAG
jgi:hypothetical protein